MKRLLVFLALTMLVLAVAASPSYAYQDAQAGAPVVTTPHTAAVSHEGNAGVTKTGAGRTGRIGGRGTSAGVVSPGHGGTGVAIGLLLALVIGGGIFAILADRRRQSQRQAQRQAPVSFGSEPAPFRRQESAEETTGDQEREAA